MAEKLFASGSSLSNLFLRQFLWMIRWMVRPFVYLDNNPDNIQHRCSDTQTLCIGKSRNSLLTCRIKYHIFTIYFTLGIHQTIRYINLYPYFFITGWKIPYVIIFFLPVPLIVFYTCSPDLRRFIQNS